MSRHKKHPSSFSPSLPGLKARIEKATSEGRFQQALELSRQLYKQEPTPEHLELLKTVSLGRARQLHEQKYDRDALTMLETAQRIDPQNPSWLLRLAEVFALCGGTQQALALLAQLPAGTDQGQILARTADAAIQQREGGRALLPANLQAEFDRVLQAFREIEAGRDEPAKNTLQGIGLRSPFLEWKVFLRGLQAYYQQDDARAVENWQRLDPDRVPARLAAPFRFQIDPAYSAAQPPATQALLRKKIEQISSSVVVTQLRHLRSTMADKYNLPNAFRQLDSLLPLLQQQAPHLVPRLANYFYWAMLYTGPDDIHRYQRAFGPPSDDPHYHRLHAMAYERGAEMALAHASWEHYLKDLPEIGRKWPAGELQRARALVWLHMGKNAARIPSKKKLAQMPAFLQGPLAGMRPLKPTAEKCFQEAIKLAPDLLDAHEALFQHEWMEDHSAKAIKAGQTLLEHFPDHVPTLERLTSLLQHVDRDDEALTLIQRALKNNPLNRQLRQKVALAHMFCARAAAEKDAFPEAREHYRQAVEIDPAKKSNHVCKWAACEFKAGENARAEELIQEALSVAGSKAAVSYEMLIEVLRLELGRALKTRFEKEFKAALAAPPTAADVIALLELTLLHEEAETNYPGRKTHVKQVLTYTEKARKTLSFTESQLALVCEALVELGAGVRSVDGYVSRGQHREFPHNPLFPYLEAVRQGQAKRPNVFRVRHLLAEAERLARALPEGPEKEAMLNKIEEEKQTTDLFGGFGGFPMPGFFDMFGTGDEDFDDDDLD